MSSLLRLVAPFLIALVCTACGKPAFSGGTFRQGDVAFKLGPVPSTWEQLESESGDLAALAFRDREERTTIGAAGRCHKDGDDVPLRALTQHLYLGFTDRTVAAENEFTLDGRGALRTEMFASLDGVAKYLVFVVLKKNSCVYDFWYIADGKKATADFDAFVNGFQTID